MGMTALFIDGAYLEKVLQHDHAKARIDFGKLAGAMVDEGDELLRAHHCNCLPCRGGQPSEDEDRRYRMRHGFYTALGRIPRFEVRLGRLAFRGVDENGSPIFQQKRVDIMLGVYMVLLALKQRVSKVALLSGDSDFAPAVEAVKAEGVLTTVWHGSSSEQTSPSDDLLQACDVPRELTRRDIQSVRLQELAPHGDGNAPGSGFPLRNSFRSKVRQ